MRPSLSMLAPLSERFPWRTRWVIALLVATVGSAAYALAEIAHGLDAALLLTIVAIAVGLGWALAAGPTRGRIALALASLAGTAVLTIRIGRIGGQLLAILVELVEFMARAILSREIVPAEPLVSAISELVLDLGVLYSRVWLWLRTLATDQWMVDPVASALVWSALIWGATVWAAWSVRRRQQPIAALLPIFALLGISYVISRGRPSSFVVPLGGTLLLMAFASHDARARRWDEDHIDSPEGKTSSLAVIVLPIAFVLTAAAAWTQSFSLNRIVRIVEGVTGDRVQDERALAESLGLSRRGAAESGLEPVLVPGLPNRHLIGSGPELSEQVVMEVTVADVPLEAPAPGYRWRALTYDKYLGRGWRTSSLRLEDIAAGEPIATPESPSDHVVHQWIRGIGDLGGLAYFAGNPAVLDQEVEVAWRDTGRDAFALTIGESLYQIESILPQASQAELRPAGTAYPDWVRESYLTLPEDVPSRVLALGRDLTATSATPYDRALAIETYLRAIPYTLDVPEPPLDRDVVDYFLFDLQKGYCDYYASSMVVLARAAGLPARLVVGYFTGTPERTEGTIRYVVTEAEAHSWVEVYFPEIGWVEFDPTGGRPAIERAEAAPALAFSETPSLELAQRPGITIRI
ncbi:MAG: transglutaminase domain-containing protein, partial [Anaerolineales bacterium]